MSTDNTPHWQQTAETLFGPDWIAPTAEVLRISRRTVERYRDGDSPVPGHVDAVFASEPPAEIDSRVYGSVVRQIANGTTPEELHDRATEILAAIAAYKALLWERDVLAVKSYVSGSIVAATKAAIPAPPPQ